MKIAGCVEYDGSKFYGWQVQPNQPTVQSAVESAISSIANHSVTVQCAGRTDTGVHACGQIIHFQTQSQRSEFSWVMGVNGKLPEGISLVWVALVAETFHARFSAVSRSYRYIILNRRVRPSYLARRTGWYPRKLHDKRMNEAAQTLIGTHDFSAFRSSRCGSKVPYKTVSKLEVCREQDWVWIDIEANGFLHHMVRNITGVLLAIGCGDQEPQWMGEVLRSKDRTKAGVTASAEGLYFVNANYPNEFTLPASPTACRFW